MQNPDKNILNIKELYHEEVEITQPECAGLVHEIYIATSKQSKTVFRFSSKECAFNNFYTSQILTKYNIPVPQTGVYKIGKKYCEIYPFIEGLTLHEKLSNNLIDQEQLYSILRQLVNLSLKLYKIPLKEFGRFNSMYRHVSMINNFFQFFQPTLPKLCHTDLTAKNIVIDDNNNVVALLDLDAIMPSHFNIMFGRISFCAKKYGFDETKVYDMYPENVVKNLYKMLDTKKQFNLYNNIMQMYFKLHKR